MGDAVTDANVGNDAAVSIVWDGAVHATLGICAAANADDGTTATTVLYATIVTTVLTAVLVSKSAGIRYWPTPRLSLAAAE